MIRRLAVRAFLQEAGFSLPEISVSIALLAMGIVGVGATMGLQAGGGLSADANFGLATVARGNGLSTAILLAQMRIEEMKSARYTDAVDQLTPVNFQDEGYGQITYPPNSYPGFRRTVTIQDGVPATGTKTISVWVFFRPPTASGLGPEESTSLTTLIAKRP